MKYVYVAAFCALLYYTDDALDYYRQRIIYYREEYGNFNEYLNRYCVRFLLLLNLL